MKTYNLELTEAEILIIHRALIGRRGMLYDSRQHLDKPEVTATDEYKEHYDTLLSQTDAVTAKFAPYINYSPEVDYENNWEPKSRGK